MTGESDEKERSLYLKLLLGLLPFDVDITITVLKDLLSEVDDTSWPSVMRRSANLGLVLSTIGIVGLALLFIYMTGFPETPVGELGIAYKTGISAVVLMWIAKFLLGLMRNIDTGNSPIVPDQEATLLTTSLEFLVGVCLIGVITIPLYQIWNPDLLLGILIAFVGVGVAICGICLTVGGAYEFIQLWNDNIPQPSQRKIDND